jgi:hypothetical protein
VNDEEDAIFIINIAFRFGCCNVSPKYDHALISDFGDLAAEGLSPTKIDKLITLQSIC